MILIVDLCFRRDSLSRPEFVDPIARIVQGEGVSCEVRHFREISDADLARADMAILCGTALMDNEFADQYERFRWTETFNRPLLGICAGMQIIGKIFGGAIEENCEIGMTAVRVVQDSPLFSGIDCFEAYELHRYASSPPESFRIVAVSKSCAQAIQHQTLPVYGVMFHPEVRNEWVVQKFVCLYTKK
jgi:GMP synthase-like glutamine amidotransferase